MTSHKGELAVVTGASSGIGLELARLCAADGYDLVIAADEAEIERAASELRSNGGRVDAVEADLATGEGFDRLMGAVGDRPVDALLANAGQGLGGAFLDQDFGAARKVVELNVVGTIALIHAVGQGMRARDRGRILVTGSTAGFMPGAFQAVYNGTKAFLDSFSMGLRNELKDTGVTVTCLMPGPTDTEFFDRAHMQDTPVGESDSKADAAKVAKDGYEAMQAGRGEIASGFMNKVQTAFAGIIPDGVMAEMHRRMAEPGR